MPVKCIPPYTPLLYNKTGFYRGKPNFLNFDSKHTLWVRLALEPYVLGENMKKKKILNKVFKFFF